MLKKIALTLVILVIAVLVVVYFARNILVKKAVEGGSEYALGVKTDLGSASLEIGGGSLELDNLAVHNPEGFAVGDFLTLKRGMIAVQTGSVLDKEVKVDSFIIDGVNLNLEQIDRKGNYQYLLDHIKRIDMSSSKESQKFRIGLIALRDINVSGSLNLLGKNVQKSFKLDDFAIRDVGNDNGARVSEIAATVVKTLISKALAAGSGVLPEGFGKNLGEMKDQAIEKAKTEATDKLKDLGKSLTGEKK